MLVNSRVSTTLDVGRLAEAVSRPGIDPRTWKSLAVVDVVHFDPEHGYFVDVTLVGGETAGMPGTARVTSFYAGPGFGAHFPIDVDDEVVVGVPNGDPAAGLVVVGRTWDAGSPPPAEVADNPTDILILAKAGATVRLAVQGDGDVVIDARGSGQVRLGSEGASHPAIQGDTLNSTTIAAIKAAAQAAAAALPGAVTASAVAGIMVTFMGALSAACDLVPNSFSPNVRVK